MFKYFLLLFLPLSLFASKILSYNIYDRTDRVDVMLTFDTPYSGVIKQSKITNKIIIKLENASIESPKIKKLSSNFLKSITLTPMNDETQITASIASSNVKLLASKTADGYGLRLRFTMRTLSKNNLQTKNTDTASFQTNLPTKKGDEFSQSYYIVIFILIIGILILFYLRRKMPQNPASATSKKGKSSNWLFQQNQQENSSTTTKLKTNSTQQEVSIRFQKALDAKNSVVMLDFGSESYLVLMGNGNILLDKFHDNKPISQQEFDTLLQERHQELEAFLHGKQDTQQKSSQEALQAYKERAASLLYNEES